MQAGVKAVLLGGRFPGARRVLPTTDTGYKSYGQGRLLLPAGTNYFTNPAFANPTDGLAAGIVDASSVTGTKTFTCVGGVQRVQYTGVAGDAPDKGLTFYIGPMPVTGWAEGEPFTFALDVSGGLSGASLYIGVYSQAWGVVADSTDPITLGPNPVRLSLSLVIPAGITGLYCTIGCVGVGNGDTVDLRFTKPMLEKSAVLTPYFDGSCPDCAWSGAANASTSERDESSLVYTTGLPDLNAAHTLACRFVPLWDSPGHAAFQSLLSVLDAPMATATKTSSMQERGLYGLNGAQFHQAAFEDAATFSAGTSHILVARYISGTTADFSIDQDDAVQAAVDVCTFTGLDTLEIGKADALLSGTPAYAYIGPVIISPYRKSDAWTAAIRADDGAAYNDPLRLWREFCVAGDMLIPLATDSVSYVKR